MRKQKGQKQKRHKYDNGGSLFENELGSAVMQHNYGPNFRQFNRKNNDKVKAMYEIYCTGKSLQWIADTLYGGKFTRQTVYDMFKVRGYKLRSKNLKPARIYKGVSYRKDSDDLYRSRLGGKTTYLHRLIWEERNGPVQPGFYVIFKDGDKENITIENLDCLHNLEAKKLYNHANQNGYKRFKNKGAFGKDGDILRL